MMQQVQRTGFTLIELSIMLVIIGLVVGGVLVGRDLIEAASIRSQISQIGLYNQAVNTFRAKYGYLPGDLPADQAAQLGFVARAGTQARGDGNGVIEEINYGSMVVYGWGLTGEPAIFWRDLTQASLIPNAFNLATDSGLPVWLTPSSSPAISAYLPVSKLHGTSYIYAYSVNAVSASFASQMNYFALSNITSVGANDGHYYGTDGGISVQEAFTLDSKVDDGLPLTGNVRAFYPSASGSASLSYAPNAVAASNTTCFDTSSKQYSNSQNGGTGMNCGLSFRFQ